MLGLFLGLTNYTLEAQEVIHRKLMLMGSRYDIYVVAANSTQGNLYIDDAVAEVSRIEKIISSWDPASQTSQINKNAGIKPVKVSDELFGLIERCIQISKLTEGAFDISYASIDKIWKFDGSMKSMPSPEAIKQSVKKIGYQKIVLNKAKHTVFLKEKGMKIGFGAIGKGYSADKAKALLLKEGVTAGIINASGDMNTWGKQPNGKDWTVAITNPFDKSKAFGVLPITNGAVVTSGTYEKYVIFNKVRYSHIINPKTGYPVSDVVSVTLFAKSAELADALSTGVFVLGKDVGIDLVNQLPDVECIFVTSDGKLATSKNIKLNKYEK